MTEGPLRARLADNSDPHAGRKAMTTQEEVDLVDACKVLNRHGQGLTRKNRRARGGVARAGSGDQLSV